MSIKQDFNMPSDLELLKEGKLSFQIYGMWECDNEVPVTYPKYKSAGETEEVEIKTVTLERSDRHLRQDRNGIIVAYDKDGWMIDCMEAKFMPDMRGEEEFLTNIGKMLKAANITREDFEKKVLAMLLK